MNPQELLRDLEDVLQKHKVELDLSWRFIGSKGKSLLKLYVQTGTEKKMKSIKDGLFNGTGKG